jgi:hypothetical protein
MGSYPTTSFLRRGVTPPKKETGYVRRPSGLFLQSQQPSQADPTVNPVSTSRVRRTVTGAYVPSPLAASQNNAPSKPPTSSAGASRAVACAHCSKVFMVATRPEAYTSVCVHCGQLNRINPL